MRSVVASPQVPTWTLAEHRSVRALGTLARGICKMLWDLRAGSLSLQLASQYSLPAALISPSVARLDEAPAGSPAWPPAVDWDDRCASRLKQSRDNQRTAARCDRLRWFPRPGFP
jgi:hypothetical protein